MDKVWPAIFNVPVLEVPVFWLTEKDTVPFPAALDPEVMVIQLTLLVAVQGQALSVVTDALPLPPEAENELGLGELTE